MAGDTSTGVERSSNQSGGRCAHTHNWLLYHTVSDSIWIAASNETGVLRFLIHLALEHNHGLRPCTTRLVSGPRAYISNSVRELGPLRIPQTSSNFQIQFSSWDLVRLKAPRNRPWPLPAGGKPQTPDRLLSQPCPKMEPGLAQRLGAAPRRKFEGRWTRGKPVNRWATSAWWIGIARVKTEFEWLGHWVGHWPKELCMILQVFLGCQRTEQNLREGYFPSQEDPHPTTFKFLFSRIHGIRDGIWEGIRWFGVIVSDNCSHNLP